MRALARITPQAGQVDAGQSTDIALTLDAAGLQPGAFAALAEDQSLVDLLVTWPDPQNDHLWDDLVDRLAAGFHAEAKHRGNRSSRLFDGAESTLRQLHRSGVRIGLCSNKPHDLCQQLVRDLGVAAYIDEVLGSSDDRPKKPDPALLLSVVERLGVPPGETLYVGDSATDVATARAAGIPVILVSYGYTLRNATQLGADAVIDSLAELVRPGPLARSA